jgi:hypothetical protein
LTRIPRGARSSAKRNGALRPAGGLASCSRQRPHHASARLSREQVPVPEKPHPRPGTGTASCPRRGQTMVAMGGAQRNPWQRTPCITAPKGSNTACAMELVSKLHPGTQLSSKLRFAKGARSATSRAGRSQVQLGNEKKNASRHDQTMRRLRSPFEGGRPEGPGDVIPLQCHPRPYTPRRFAAPPSMGDL